MSRYLEKHNVKNAKSNGRFVARGKPHQKARARKAHRALKDGGTLDARQESGLRQAARMNRKAARVGRVATLAGTAGLAVGAHAIRAAALSGGAISGGLPVSMALLAAGTVHSARKSHRQRQVAKQSQQLLRQNERQKKSLIPK